MISATRYMCRGIVDSSPVELIRLDQTEAGVTTEKQKLFFNKRPFDFKLQLYNISTSSRSLLVFN